MDSGVRLSAAGGKPRKKKQDRERSSLTRQELWEARTHVLALGAGETSGGPDLRWAR